MWRGLLVIVAISATTEVARADPTAVAPVSSPPVIVRAEQCLRDHVDRVVTDDRDLQSAANFLVDFVCAKEVTAAGAYQRNLMVAAQANAMMKMMLSMSLPPGGKPSSPPAPPSPPPSPVSVDPDTGALIVPPQPSGAPLNSMLSMLPQISTQMSSQLGSDRGTVELRALAGDLVINAYENLTAAHPGR